MAKTILIVEDHELHMKLFDDLLRAKGYLTVGAGTGAEALERARDSNPDLILMDIQLPGISGLDVTRTLKADDALKDIPVIAVTVFAMEADEKMCRDAGCDGYITKPISVAGFLETISGFLD